MWVPHLDGSGSLSSPHYIRNTYGHSMIFFFTGEERQLAGAPSCINVYFLWSGTRWTILVGSSHAFYSPPQEMIHSWPPLLTAIHTPSIDEPSKSSFSAKVRGKSLRSLSRFYEYYSHTYIWVGHLVSLILLAKLVLHRYFITWKAMGWRK